MKRTFVAAVSLLLLCGQASWAGELSCDSVDQSNCTFTFKKVLFCQTEGVFDNGACVSKADELAATAAQCSSLGYPSPAGYDHRAHPYPNYKLYTPRVSVPSNAACPKGQKRYWKYSCCRYRHCGDLVNTNGDPAPDGKVTAEDVSALIGQAWYGSKQRTKAADLNGDGQITGYDEDIMSAYVDDGVVAPFLCKLEPKTCKLPCGDTNGDGQGLDINDMTAMVNWVNRIRIPTRCQFWASDLNADGKLDATDMAIIQDAWSRGDVVPLSGCAE